jgi:predicted nucleic acid-binding protein
MMRALLDTSVVIAYSEEGIEVFDPDIEGAISIVTLCELHHGVLAATEEDRPIRLRGFDWVRHNLEMLPAGDRVAPWYGQLMDEARRATGVKPEFADALIAATAMAYGLPVLTRDGDFKSFSGLEVVLI